MVGNNFLKCGNLLCKCKQEGECTCLSQEKMIPKETNVRLKFVAKLIDDTKGNYFTNIPKDLQQFLHGNDGTMQGIVENLYPDQVYEIEIKIKTINQLN